MAGGLFVYTVMLTANKKTLPAEEEFFVMFLSSE